MKRFVKVMALFALLLLTIYVFEKLQPTMTALTKATPPTPLTTYAVYEVRQLQWAFDDPSDYSYDEALINLSGGEARLRLQKVLKEIRNFSEITLLVKKEEDGIKTYKKEREIESSAYSYGGELKNLYFEADIPQKTSVKFKIKTAATEDGLKKADWQPKGRDYYTTTGQAITAEPNGYVQHKAVLETDDDAKTPTLNSVTITYETEEYPAEAAITTKEYAFGRRVEVQQLISDEQLNGQAASYYYSTDSGQTWKTPISGQILATAADKILIKAALSSNKTETPIAKGIKLSYRISVCDEKWQANYTSCGKNDKRTKYYTDANSCGSTEDIPPDNGTAESCDYCAPSFICGGYGDCSEDNKKACTQVNDSNSCYEKTGLASDNYSGSYSEFFTSCVFDSESPIVSNVTASVSGSTLTITASITDKSATTATAQVVKEGMAVMNVSLANITKDTYLASASAAGLRGAYLIAIVAKDRHNNTARTKGVAGIAVQAEKSAEADVVLNLSRKSVLRLTNTTTIELTGKAEQSATGKLIISEHKSDIRNTTKPAGKRELQKYVEVEADEGLKANISSATLRISYTDEDAMAANISEANLAMYFYNETALLWQQLNSTANTALNHVEGNTTHLSLFSIFGAEQNQTAAANATVNSTLTNATNATTTNQTTTNQTAGTTVNETGTIPQQKTSATAEAAADGGVAGSAEDKKEEAIQAANATEAEECSYEVKVELAGKLSFISTSMVNATLANTGTCALHGIEMKLTKPLDSYISVENGNASEIGPAESLAFALKLKAPSGEAQKQPLHGFAVKEPRKKAVYTGKIVITGHGVKGLGLDIEEAGPKLEKEVPMNIEIYELEQKRGKNAIATATIAAFILLGVLGISHRAMAKKRNKGNRKEINCNNSESSTAKETSPTPEPEHEKEKLGFEEKLKSVAEKWDQRRQNEENSKSGDSEGEDKSNNKLE